MNRPKIVKLWEGQPPTSNGITEKEEAETSNVWITNVSVPEIHIYLPEASVNTGMAVIICPGGGYEGLAFSHEGVLFAKWLTKKGIAGVVLKYRMPNHQSNIPVADVFEAIAYVRSHSEDLHINLEKVGVAGFSAGGHLAAIASTQCKSFAPTGCNPDFSILFYPVITMGDETHLRSRNNLLGNSPTDAEIDNLSAEKQVDSKTPPTILLLSDDDKAVTSNNSISYYRALKNNDIPATMYVFPEGGHGWGMNRSFKYHVQMLALLEEWLKDIENK